MTITAMFLTMLASVGEPTVTVEAPSYVVPGQSFEVTLVAAAGNEAATLEGWKLTPAGFTLDGQPLADKGDEALVELAPGQKKMVKVDLAAALKGKDGGKLAWGSQDVGTVRALEPAPAGLDFINGVPLADLDGYNVLLRTNRGDVLVEFWPDVAPNHVRNFLDLAYTEFYDDVTFHRVIPGFMIQGGDPGGTGTGSGPRRLKAEFNDKKHLRGVLSMARSQSPDSASCQFFIMHQNAPHLDGGYSAFGKVVTGMDAVDRIVSTPRGMGDKPNSPQVILHAWVVKAGEGAAEKGQ